MPVLAQTDIINRSLTRPELNILYLGIDNIVEIISEKVELSYKIISSTSIDSKLTSNKYIIKTSSALNDTLKLYKGSDLILTKVFEVKELGDPIGQLGNLRDTLASTQEILTYTTLKVVIPNCYLLHGFTIRSFKVKISNRQGGDIINFGEILGNQVPFDFKNYASKLKKGDKVIFTEITATCPECQLRRLNDLTITIK
jgi:hypothetical protein